MLDAPLTMEQAKNYKYGKWAGNKKGTSYTEGRCAYSVYDSLSWIPHQCTRKAKFGPDNLYCKQHAKTLGFE